MSNNKQKLHELKQKIKTEAFLNELGSVKEWGGADWTIFQSMIFMEL
jgi:hypothetical protein|tara:strand:+ start:26 stop:166 length:141 start_codon:yes stop_codon:yes gene_type:complete